LLADGYEFVADTDMMLPVAFGEEEENLKGKSAL
jgi:hypothetical protein